MNLQISGHHDVILDLLAGPILSWQDSLKYGLPIHIEFPTGSMNELYTAWSSMGEVINKIDQKGTIELSPRSFSKSVPCGGTSKAWSGIEEKYQRLIKEDLVIST